MRHLARRRRILLYLAVIVIVIPIARLAGHSLLDGKMLAASARGDAGRVRLLLLAGANINAEDAKGGTPLFLAALHGRAELVHLLRVRGGDISERCRYGNAPALPALRARERFTSRPRSFTEYCEAGDIVQVRKMLKADPGLASSMAEEDKMPIGGAISHDQVEIVKLLLQYGASPVNGGEDIMPIEMAWYCNNREIEDLLMRKMGSFGDWCALGDAARAREMLDKNPNIIEQNPSYMDEDFTPLILGITHRKTPVVRLLVERGAKINRHGVITPLEWAAREGVTEIVAILLAHGADPNMRSTGGDVPLASAKTSEISALLIAKGADVNATDAMGQTPLLHARNAEQRELLVRFGAK